MTTKLDIVATVPKSLWRNWIEEGDLPDSDWSGLISHFWTNRLPDHRTYRLYIVSHGRVRGYAPITGYERHCRLNPAKSCIMRQGGARAVTINQEISGFQGWRYRWWDRAEEVDFPAWASEDVK